METKQRNKNLIEAKKNKNDEFYTVYEDVANELEHYADQLKNKAILCPCDYDFYKEFSKEEREKIFKGEMTDKNDIGSFSRYLYNKQDETSPEKGWNNQLYFSHYNPKTNDGVPFEQSIRQFAKKHPDGVVITNPPFSLFGEFMEILQETGLKFLIIGSMNAITYKETFKYIKENKLWLGYTNPKTFTTPENKKMDVLTRWFTNLDVEKRHIELPLSYSYKDNPELYPKYDNYDAINVDKVKEIPYDYDGYIGVPISFLEKYNPEQFEIVCASFEIKDNPDFQFLKINDKNFIKTINKFDRGYIKGQRLYARIIIKNKQPELPE